MATPLVTKIVMKNTTKMSLNERFTAYRAQAQSSTNTFRQKIQMQRQATSANLRLAQQMANRPTVIAALRLKKRSLQQRLGGRQQSASNVKARLNLNVQRMNNNSGGIQGRLGNFRGRGTRRRGSFKPGTSPLLKARLGLPRPTFNPRGQQSRGSYRNRRGNFQNGNRQNFQVGNRQSFQVGNRQSRGNVGGGRLPASRNARGGRGGRGGFGRFGGTNAAAAVPNKQELDDQLDAYMADAKATLDTQLDNYMSQG